ncbi:hypothetical protein Patl1_32178 [Pistacia atlantica]|uniref:Uncharacterized protein n=1 Tax=Pistacia atlantica TaxID=434234 RepID=A0ACC1ANJ5_9ROSI|nr:hypothetical protein Patl1_32178 [Pistacia atlantica]
MYFAIDNVTIDSFLLTTRLPLVASSSLLMDTLPTVSMASWYSSLSGSFSVGLRANERDEITGVTKVFNGRGGPTSRVVGWMTIGGIVEGETVSRVVEWETTGGVTKRRTAGRVVEGRGEANKNVVNEGEPAIGVGRGKTIVRVVGWITIGGVVERRQEADKNASYKKIQNSSQWVTIGGIVEREIVGGVVKGETTVGVVKGRKETDKNGSYKKIQNGCHSS